MKTPRFLILAEDVYLASEVTALSIEAPDEQSDSRWTIGIRLRGCEDWDEYEIGDEQVTREFYLKLCAEWKAAIAS